MGRRPLIGVTGPNRGGLVAWMATRSVLASEGARSIWMTPDRGRDAGGIDGLILGGGADVSPDASDKAMDAFHETVEGSREAVHAGRTPRWTLVRAPATLLLRRWLSRSPAVLDSGRDAYELRVFERAVKQNIPILGICRGAQLLNVARGGTLHADISVLLGETPRPRTVLPRVPIEIAPWSRLAAHIGTTQLLINALHHQSVESPAGGLLVVAHDHTGIVQAIEDAHHPFILGVQWHPEYMPQHPYQRALFRSFVATCAG